jgi:integrase/recombinase XerD
MFEEIFCRNAARYRAAPLVEQRERYLRHLKELGTSRSTLRKCANDQLSFIRLLNLQGDDQASIHRIEAAAIIWSRPKGRRCNRPASAKARARFVSRGIQWLRFLGWLNEPEHERHPHHVVVAIFEKWLREERGLSDATIQSYCHAADHFFIWLAAKGTPLVAVQIADIDDAVAAEHKRGAWNRRTTHDYAQRLRAFFLYAETRSWCRTGLAAGIMAPRFMADETVPKGIRREDVLRLLASVQGDRPVDKRDLAILMLFVTYGLRAGEVAGLRLDDLDWENEIIRVRCPKPGRTHVWPLSPESYGRNWVMAM